jgi:hypothetical protein
MFHLDLFGLSEFTGTDYNVISPVAQKKVVEEETFTVYKEEEETYWV